MIIVYVVLCLLALVAAVYLINLIEHDPGYLLISYDKYTVETSVWVAVAIIILGSILIWVLLSLFFKLLRQSRIFGNWFSGRGTRKARQQTHRGIVAFNEGNWERAHRLLARSAQNSDLPLVNYLYAAKASNRAGNIEEADKLLAAASQDTASVTAIELTQAEMQLEQNKLEDCLATLSRLKNRSAHSSPRVNELLKDVYMALGDWPSLQGLLPEIKKLAVLPEAEFNDLEKTTAVALMRNALVNRNGNPSDALASAWKQLSKLLQSDVDVLSVYVDCSSQIGEQDLAEKQLRKELNESWSKPLVNLYGDLVSNDAKKQLIHAEKWLQERNSDAALLLAAGKLAERAGEKAKAKEYVNSSLQLEPNAEAYQVLAGLYAQEGDNAKCAEYFLESRKAVKSLALVSEATKTV